jgi:hypothetical protein
LPTGRRLAAKPLPMRDAAGLLLLRAMLKSETWIAEGHNELFNRQFEFILITFFPSRKFSSLIMMLIYIHAINRVPFVSQPPEYA